MKAWELLFEDRMGAILTIDIGNTRGKFAVFSREGAILSFGYLEDLEHGLGEVKRICDDSFEFSEPICSIVYSTVKKIFLDWAFWDLLKFNPVEIKDLMYELPFQVDIEQPETLGSDRLAGVMGCVYLLEKRNTGWSGDNLGRSGELHNQGLSSNTKTNGSDDELGDMSPKKTENVSNKDGVSDFMMIDVGTCVTYDYVIGRQWDRYSRNSSEIAVTDDISGRDLNVESNVEPPIYFGGAISPGLRLRFKAMSDYTDALPLLDVGWEDSSRLEIGDIGKHTVEAMNSGVMMGFVDEISGRIDRFKEKFVDSQVFLTGGDAEFLGKRLKSGIFVEPMLLHYGLFYADKFKR